MKKIFACFLLLAMVNQILFPSYAHALTAGPAQPESTGFQQIDQTDLVDLFSGDFKYNIPLLDIDGYPLNLTYNSNVSMEQEASWVGLGWNLQVGSITRGVNGVPDDFNNDLLEEEIQRKPRVSVTLRAAPTLEFLGKKSKKLEGLSKKFGKKLNPDLGLRWSNYDGFGLSMNVGIKPELFKNYLQLNLGFDSQSGVSANTSLAYAHNLGDKKSGDVKVSGGLSFGMNSQGGIQGINFNTAIDKAAIVNGSSRSRETYTRGVDPQIISEYYSFTLAPFGGTVSGWNKDLTISGMYSKSSLIANNFSTPTAGYFYLQNASENAITDFSKDADPVYNEEVNLIPAASMTYDSYSVSSHGLGGTFRPIRNEIATVGDPRRNFDSGDDLQQRSFAFDYGQGSLFKMGTDLENTISSSTTSRLRENSLNAIYRFKNQIANSLYEPVYFKFEDEPNIIDQNFYTQIKFDEPIALDFKNQTLLNKVIDHPSNTLALGQNLENRMPRNKLIQVYDQMTYDEEFGAFARPSKALNNFSYQYFENAMSETHPSNSNNAPHREKLNISLPSNYGSHKFRGFEITDESGMRHGFLLPAINKLKVEASFSVKQSSTTSSQDYERGIVQYSMNGVNPDVEGTTDEYLSKKKTSSFAHTFLLTHITSPDYVDVSNDGFTDDDLGTFTEFRYTCTSQNYKWRAPYESFRAKLMPGSLLTKEDDKANYTYGVKELWYLNSVVGKHHIAIFKISPRNDGVGVRDENGGLPSNITLEDRLFKLDEIILFNKQDYFENPALAKPIKRVVFNYSYRLCKFVPNFSGSQSEAGKLTLESVQLVYGNSNKGYLTPYKFTYSIKNPNYDQFNMDRWGNYQSYAGRSFNAGDYPYTFQNKQLADENAKSWLLTQINAPGGAITKIEYESDSYRYVQNREAMAMYEVLGFTDEPDINATIKDRIGGVGNNDLHYLVVKLSNNPIDGFTTEKLRSQYLAGIKHLGFSFLTSIVNSRNENGGFDRIKGYAEIDISDSHVRDNTTCFIKIVPKNVAKTLKINGIRHAILNQAQLKLSRFINPGNNPNNNDIENIIKSIVSVTSELVKLAVDPKIIYVQNGVGSKMNVDKSWVRLNIGERTKFGGGARVRKIETIDSWAALAGDNRSRNASYGQLYEYIVPGTNGQCSGVASYEPFIGGDENPFKQPVFYLSTNTFSNKIIDYQELPVCESYFPSASVGYSHVTVRNMHYEYAQSSREFVVNEFYTARDFPVSVKATAIKRDVSSPNLFNPTFQRSHYVVSQGYSVITNGMHGKSKKIDTYLGTTMESSRPVNSIRYYYSNLPNVSGDGASGKLKTLFARQDLKSDWQETHLNRRVDMVWNPHYFSENQYSTKFSFDLEVTQQGPLIIPIPRPFFSTTSAYTQFVSSCLTKHVDYKPVLIKTVTKSLGKLEEIENLVFDFFNLNAVSKRVSSGGLLTNIVEIPYHLVLNNRAKDVIDRPYPNFSYGSINYKANVNISQGFLKLSNYSTSDYFFNFIYDVGDELIFTNTLANGQTTKFKAWVAKTEISATTDGGCRKEINVYFIDEQGLIVPDGSYVVKILRKGGKNISGLKCLSFVSNSSSLFSGTLSYHNYDFNEVNSQRCIPTMRTSSGYAQTVTNPFLNGRMNGFGHESSFTFYGERKYTEPLIRNQGYLNVAVGEEPYHMNEFGSSIDNCFYGYGIEKRQGLAHWKKLVEVTKVNRLGNVIETKDNEQRYSSAVYSPIFNKIILSAKHARNSQVMFDGFEDYDVARAGNYHEVRHSLFDLVTYNNITNAYRKPSNKHAQWFLDPSVAHTGKYALRVNKGAGESCRMVIPFANALVPNSTTPVFTIPSTVDGYDVGFNPWLKSGTYKLSVWVRDNDYLRMNGVYTQSVIINIGSIGVSLMPTGPKVAGWQKIQGSFEIPNGNANMNLEVILHGGKEGGWFDDLRIFPENALVTTYVYDYATKQLRAILDDNNYATFYEYNQSAEMIRVKKETERGIMTLKEEIKSIKID